MNTKIFLVGFVVFLRLFAFSAAEESNVFKAAAARIDITPQTFPVTVNGGFLPWQTDKVIDPLYARCLILHDGTEQIVFIVIDSCMIPLEMADTIKTSIAKETKIGVERIMISATHCHSAPSLIYALGTPPDENYIAYLPGKIVELVAETQKKLEPAKVGWAVGEDRNNVYVRRFYMKKGTATTNPFSGKKNDRAQMNPGHANKNKIARTGPVDPSVSVLSVMTKDDKPLAVLANYSTHYAGVSGGLSGDYFGVFSEEIKRLIADKVGSETVSENFLGIMTNGTSGDANCIDFLNPDRKFTYKTVGAETAAAAMAVWPNIRYFDWVPLGIVEKRIEIANRIPTAEEVKAAKEHLTKLDGGKIKTGIDVYAQSTVMMENWPKTSVLPIQAFRIGELGVTALPAEVYGMTGLEIKARSPFAPTMNISMANGYFGYVPPAEQHALGGYNTWRTQTSCLAEDAEAKIKQTAVELLQSLAP